MNKMFKNLIIKTSGNKLKLNRNYKAYICSSFGLKRTFEEIDLCG